MKFSPQQHRYKALSPSYLVQFFPEKFEPGYKTSLISEKLQPVVLKIALANGWIIQDENGFYLKTDFCPGFDSAQPPKQD